MSFFHWSVAVSMTLWQPELSHKTVTAHHHKYKNKSDRQSLEDKSLQDKNIYSCARLIRQHWLHVSFLIKIPDLSSICNFLILIYWLHLYKWLNFVPSIDHLDIFMTFWEISPIYFVNFLADYSRQCANQAHEPVFNFICETAQKTTSYNSGSL